MMGAFDTALVTAGEFGPYQKRLYFLLCLLCFTTGVSAVVVVLVVAEPSHRCAIPSYMNDSYKVQDEYHASLINRSIPIDISRGGKISYDACSIYHDNNENVSSSLSDRALNNDSELTSCNRWVYDKTDFESTAVSEMDMVCESSWLRSHAKMAFMLGKAFGVFFLSIFSDLFGRKKLMVLSMALSVVSGFASAWVQSTVALCFSLAFLGASNAGVYTAIFVIGMEVTGPKKRYYAGTILDFFFAMGECSVAAVGYLLRDRNLTVTILIIPNALLLPCLCLSEFVLYHYPMLVPESPRWLLQKGRRKDAVKILQKLASVNKRTLDDKKMQSINQEHDNQESVLEVLRAWRVTWRFIFVFFNWFSVSIVFYGLSLNSMDAMGNPYLNLFLFSTIEFPAYVIDMVLLKFIGRRSVICLAMCFGGAACILTIFPILYGNDESERAILVLELIGKFGAAMAFTTLYTFTSELIPTTVRSRGIGTSSTFARIGGAVAPYVSHLEGFIDGPARTALPMVCYGSIAILTGLLNVLLPETKDRPMPETVADLKITMRNRKQKEEMGTPERQTFPLV